MSAADPSDRCLAGRYRMGGLLGRGGMAEVYDGHDERLGRPVAIKLLRPDMAAHPEVRGRFEVEARAAARLSHPNVVAVFDTGEDDGTPFIVMERLPGETLADRMAAGPIEQAWLRRVAGDVLGALDAAHAAGIVHRDIKPGNILISDDGCAKVADFGIAKSAEAAAGDPTAVGLLLGTPAYLAPERLDGDAATPRSDLFALGVVLYEALAGTKPFSGATPMSVATAIKDATPVPLSEMRPGLDPTLVAVVAAALAKDPADRPASARAMAAALHARLAVPPLGGVIGDDATVNEAAEIDATSVADRAMVAPVPPPPGRRRSGLWALAAGVLIVVLLVAAALANGGNEPAVAGDDDVIALRELAERVEVGDGAEGPQAATRLRDIAGELDLGDEGAATAAAQALLADSLAWRQRGELSETASAEITALLDRLPGVDAAAIAATTTTVATTSTTTAPAPTAPPPAAEPRNGYGDDEGVGERNGRGKGRESRESREDDDD